jgi:hypothetical protein
VEIRRDWDGGRILPEAENEEYFRWRGKGVKYPILRSISAPLTSLSITGAAFSMTIFLFILLFAFTAHVDYYSVVIVLIFIFSHQWHYGNT